MYPKFVRGQIPELRRGLQKYVKTKPVTPLFVLGVMEVEAWFLAEHHHFPAIHPALTCERIRAELGFDPATDDMQARPCPHDDLHAVYQLERLDYRKRADQIQRTVDVLDYEYAYVEMPARFAPDLQNFVAALDGFFTPADSP